ncbi:bacteriocin immunity protein [Paracoccus thiocyanatus]|uniref:bacteriocin immunity protein n=1 Tax=Paracoccus thiocyanatus TaxID=34006 RepID=UPI00122C9CE1|nr:bacteriocin immunity protein [Paracoccus thiocyanatus]
MISTPITEEEYAQILARARNEPGVASGAGKQVGTDWLSEGIRNGVMPVPASVAEKLEGRRFGSFDSYPRAFWKAVAAEPELLGQFDEFAQDRIRNGLAPSAPYGDSAGLRDRWEMDHIEPLWRDGKLYDSENLQLMTPKSHIEKSREDMNDYQMIDCMKVKSISELTRKEFLDFVILLGKTPGKTEAEDSRWIRKFCELAQHRKGWDILFYPEPGKNSRSDGRRSRTLPPRKRPSRLQGQRFLTVIAFGGTPPGLITEAGLHPFSAAFTHSGRRGLRWPIPAD